MWSDTETFAQREREKERERCQEREMSKEREREMSRECERERARARARRITISMRQLLEQHACTRMSAQKGGEIGNTRPTYFGRFIIIGRALEEKEKETWRFF